MDQKMKPYPSVINATAREIRRETMILTMILKRRAMIELKKYVIAHSPILLKNHVMIPVNNHAAMIDVKQHAIV
jgi:hypothetical protein